MATLVLQTVGSVVGGAIGGPIGGVVGRLLGGLGGGLIDQALQPHASPRYGVGPRLKSMDGVMSTEGAGVPRVYGRARLGGQMIWATRFLERVNVAFEAAPRNGKGNGGGDQQRVNFTYVYSANFAIGLCEGPIAFVRRIWADGAELDMTTLPIHIYKGTQDQEADPLIIAKEGAENVPAYRGLAYIVFDDLALAPFGNRIPQFTFEVVKPVAGLGEMIRAIGLAAAIGARRIRDRFRAAAARRRAVPLQTLLCRGENLLVYAGQLYRRLRKSPIPHAGGSDRVLCVLLHGLSEQVLDIRQYGRRREHPGRDSIMH